MITLQKQKLTTLQLEANEMQDAQKQDGSKINAFSLVQTVMVVTMKSSLYKPMWSPSDFH